MNMDYEFTNFTEWFNPDTLFESGNQWDFIPVETPFYNESEKTEVAAERPILVATALNQAWADASVSSTLEESIVNEVEEIVFGPTPSKPRKLRRLAKTKPAARPIPVAAALDQAQPSSKVSETGRKRKERQFEKADEQHVNKKKKVDINKSENQNLDKVWTDPQKAELISLI